MRIKIYLLVLILISMLMAVVYFFEGSWTVLSELLDWIGFVVFSFGCIYFTTLYTFGKGKLKDFLMHKLFLFVFMVIYYTYTIVGTVYGIYVYRYNAYAFLFSYEFLTVLVLGILIYLPALYISFFYMKRIYTTAKE